MNCSISWKLIKLLNCDTVTSVSWWCINLLYTHYQKDLNHILPQCWSILADLGWACLKGEHWWKTIIKGRKVTHLLFGLLKFWLHKKEEDKIDITFLIVVLDVLFHSFWCTLRIVWNVLAIFYLMGWNPDYVPNYE